MVCIGQAPLDLVLREMSGLPAPTFPATARAVSANPGGMANIAVALSRLGVPVALASGVGDDRTGDQLREMLEAEGVVPPPQRPGTRTDLSLSMPFDGDRALVSFQGTAPSYAPAPDDPYWHGVDAVCFDVGCGIDPRVAALAPRGVALFGDTGWEEDRFCLDNCLRALPSLTAFLPNEMEALALTGTSGVEDAAAALAALVPIVVIKRGARGAIARRGNEVARVEAPPAVAIDTTGAGDILNAGFMFGWQAELSLEQSLRLGCLAATVSVTRPGSSLSAPTWRDLAQFVAALPEVVRGSWEPVLSTHTTDRWEEQ